MRSSAGLFRAGPISGGLNNQKLTLLGACLLARERGGHAGLPKTVHDFEPAGSRSRDVFLPYDAVFDASHLAQVLRDLDLIRRIALVDGRRLLKGEPIVAELPASECFLAGAAALR